MKKTLLQSGDKIPVELVHVSPMNVRYGQPFDPEKNERDWMLVRNVRAGGVEQPFKVRPEKNPETKKDGYGVYMGRRRFLAEVYLGKKEFTVGEELLVREASDYEARKSSFIEGDDALRDDVDPISRAEQLQQMAAENPRGITGVAEDLGAGKGRISEYLRVLDLDPEMQKQVSEERLNYSAAVRLARMELGSEAQKELAKTLETEGLEGFEKELKRFTEKELRRGVPPGKYWVIRVMLDKYFRDDVEDIKKLDWLAEQKHMERDKVAKELLHERLKDVEIGDVSEHH